MAKKLSQRMKSLIWTIELTPVTSDKYKTRNTNCSAKNDQKPKNYSSLFGRIPIWSCLLWSIHWRGTKSILATISIIEQRKEKYVYRTRPLCYKQKFTYFSTSSPETTGFHCSNYQNILPHLFAWDWPCAYFDPCLILLCWLRIHTNASPHLKQIQ